LTRLPPAGGVVVTAEVAPSNGFNVFQDRLVSQALWSSAIAQFVADKFPDGNAEDDKHIVPF